MNAHIVDRAGTWVTSAHATVSLGGSSLTDFDLIRVAGDSREGDYQATYQAAANTTSQPQTCTVTATATDEAGHTSEQATTTFTAEAISTPPPPPVWSKCWVTWKDLCEAARRPVE